MLITSLENSKIKDILKLKQKKYRDLTQTFIIEGAHLVEEAYKNNLLDTLIIEENLDYKLDVPTLVVTYDIIKKISDTITPQKIMGICKKKQVEKINGNVLILDGIQDPGNLGTIIRSAVAFNIKNILLSKDTVDLYNPKVIRSTQGMLFNINIVRKNLEEILPYLKSLNYTIYATDVNGGNELKTLEKKSPFAIIMGSEGKGIKKEILSFADEKIYISMNDSCESLNVGVAASIILYILGG